MVKFVSSLRQLGVLLSFLLLSGSGLAEECFPEPDDSKPQYMIGYASYLYEEARKNSEVQLKLDAPVWVEGYKRGWLTRTKPETIKMTELGVVPSDGSRFNAVLMSVQAGDLSGMDKNKKYYCRVKVDASKIKPMTGKKAADNAEYWIYQTRKKQVNEAVSNFPVYQSFVDEFLTGCVNLSNRFKLPEFANQCMETTAGWSESWVNDRQRPISGKSIQARKKEVDDLLMKYQKQYFRAIRAG